MSSDWIHIPTPGDHYSAATGSAIMTIIYELNRRHIEWGGSARIVVGKGTRHDYGIGECEEVRFAELPSRTKKIMDVALGRLGFHRFWGARLYLPASYTIPQSTDAAIFVWNNPAPLMMLRRRHPQARICLYAQNSLFRTYSAGEARRILAAVDAVICCSQFIADELQRHLGQQSRKVHVVLNGVDTTRFCPADVPVRDETPVILFVGRVTPEKGADLLLNAAQRLHNSGQKFKVRIVGSSNFNANDPLTVYEQELRELAEPMREKVEFQPFVDRKFILEEYQRAAIFCVPSNWDEPVSLTISEGMACGLPVIASRRGGIPEVGGDAVRYFQTPNVDELAEQLNYFLDCPAARQEWGAKARKRVEMLSWHVQYESLRRAVMS